MHKLKIRGEGFEVDAEATPLNGPVIITIDPTQENYPSTEQLLHLHTHLPRGSIILVGKTPATASPRIKGVTSTQAADLFMRAEKHWPSSNLRKRLLRLCEQSVPPSYKQDVLPFVYRYKFYARAVILLSRWSRFNQSAR